MSDIATQLRRAAALYSESYPPEILSGSGGPHIDSVSPAAMYVVDAASLVSIIGLGFEPTSVAELNGAALDTTYTSENRVEGAVDPAALGLGTHSITVRNVDTSESNSVPFAVIPLPTIASITPATATTTQAYRSYTVTGTNFTDGCSLMIGTKTTYPTIKSQTEMEFSMSGVSLGLAAGTHQAKVITGMGIEGTNSIPFTVTAATGTTTEGTDETDYVCAHGTVEDVKLHIASHPEQVRAALEAERAGKHRSTLIGWLEDFEVDLYPVIDVDQPGPAGDEV